jgi:hypothetical protein
MLPISTMKTSLGKRWLIVFPSWLPFLTVSTCAPIVLKSMTCSVMHTNTASPDGADTETLKKAFDPDELPG